MIVPMKKATIFIETKDAEATVTYVRKLGALQVEHQNVPEGKDISALQEKVALIDTSFDVLNRIEAPQKNKPLQRPISGDWMTITNRIIALSKDLEQMESSSRQIKGQIDEWERWGDVDQIQIQHLSQKGIYFKLYQVPVKEIKNFPTYVVVKIIYISGDFAFCVAISNRQFECVFTEILPPKEKLSLLKKQLVDQTNNMELTKKEISEYSSFSEDLSGKRKNLEKEIQFRQVLSGMGKEGKLCYITGYIPIDLEGRLLTDAKIRKWGVLITEPSTEDIVPTLLRNPKWANLISPVLDFLGLTPGYQELDVSIPFLIFFSIFFGMLIGDAGYGLIYILISLFLAFWLHKQSKLDTRMKTIISLFCLLGSCAIIWGVLTGTFFGPGMIQALLPKLNDATFLQMFCFFLGAFHLSLAHFWRSFLKFPALTALADIGYICILWTAFFLANTLILGEVFPSFGIWLVIIGVVLVILFTNPQVRVLRGIGEGLGTMALSFMNNITDVISYVRLFAVGLAGLAIAETANTLSSGFGNGIIALLAGFVILIIGHGLNIVLGIISILVHGVRLNVLEFSGHANVTWSGSAFEPLKE